MAETWAPGETIVGQSVWDGKVRVACPMVVIHDRPDVLAAYIPYGQNIQTYCFIIGCQLAMSHVAS